MRTVGARGGREGGRGGWVRRWSWPRLRGEVGKDMREGRREVCARCALTRLTSVYYSMREGGSHTKACGTCIRRLIDRGKLGKAGGQGKGTLQKSNTLWSSHIKLKGLPDNYSPPHPIIISTYRPLHSTPRQTGGGHSESAHSPLP
jgi:hypothetical protein